VRAVYNGLSRVLSCVLYTREGSVKLAASLFCVAALSVVGCADVETTGGGQGEGILPDKISLANPNEPKPFDPSDVISYEQRLGHEGADSICEGCVVDTYGVHDNSMGIDEVRIVSDGGGLRLCKIYLDDNGEAVVDECGWHAP
jgi:hypothetical protein